LLSPELFQGNIAAHLHYAAGLPPEEAERILRGHQEDGSWKEEATHWIQVASQLDARTRKQGTADSLIAECARQLVGAALDAELHDFLPRLIEEHLKAPATAASMGPSLVRLVDWLIQSAKAGNAGLVAEVLDTATRQLSLSMISSPEEETRTALLAEKARRSELLRFFTPLARWLLEKGSAELRRSERADLLVTMLECLAEGTTAELRLLLRYISLQTQDNAGFWRQHAGLFWSTAERILAEGGSWLLICELVATMYRGNLFAEDCLQPLLDPEELPRARDAILRGLLAGRFDSLQEGFHGVVWRTIFSRPPEGPEALRFSHGSTLERALEVLCQAAAEKAPPEPLSSWARLLSCEWLQVQGLQKERLEPLLRVAESPGMEKAVATAFQTVLAGVPQSPNVQLALRILDDSSDSMSAVRAVLCLDLQRPATIPSGNDERLHLLLEEFHRIIHLPWSEPVFGIDLGRILRDVQGVRLAHLGREDLVNRKDEQLILHEPPYRQMATTIEDEEKFLANATLYFLHELVHVEQGIGAKQSVDRLRETGGESTLMHLDLSADHAAARLVHRAVPRWTLAWLKDLQGRSLLGYPVGRGHTAASRGRKTSRLISLRLDYLVRAASNAPSWSEHLREGYVFTEFSPGGGAMLLLVSGPPVSLVDSTHLGAAQAALLTTAMDEREGETVSIDEIDHLLRGSFNLE